jgi:transcriptional regulator with XRE-family HTH domain
VVGTTVVLDQEQLKRRLVAARALRDVSQAELAGQLEADGLGKHDLGRIERGDLTMMPAHRRALAHHLRLPERWFTDPDTDSLLVFDEPRDVSDDDLRRAAELLAPQLLSAARALRQEQDSEQPSTDGPGRQSAGGEAGA